MNPEDQITEKEQSIRLTDLLQMARAYFLYVLRYWWVPVIAGLLFAAYSYYKTSKLSPTYVAKLSFILMDNQSPGGGSFANILSQFGLASGKKGANMDRIIDLMNSREIIGRVLFTKIGNGENRDFLANHYIDVFKLQEAWRETPNEELHNFYFQHDSLEAFTYLENSVFKGLKSRIIKLHMSYDITDGDMFIIRMVSTSESMSLDLVNVLFKVLSDYYVEKTIEKHKESFDIVRARTDSLKRVLLNTEARLAKFQDSNRSIFKKESLMKEDRMAREVTLANSLYIESARNLESARMSLLSSKPIIQPVDLPIYPLTGNFPKAIPEGIKGGLIGGIFAVFLLFGIKFIHDLLEREKLEIKHEEASF